MRLTTILAISMTALATGVANGAPPMTGKMAKFDVAGRIAAVAYNVENHRPTECKIKRFKGDEALRLLDVAQMHAEKRFDTGEVILDLHQNTPERLAAFVAALEGAKAKPQNKAFCDQLYIDAGNWEMLNFLPMTKAEKVELTMLVAITNTDCEAPVIAEAADRVRAPNDAGVRYDELMALHDSAETEAIVDAGYTFGVTMANCPAIEKFATELVQK